MKIKHFLFCILCSIICLFISIHTTAQFTFWIADFENGIGNNAWTLNISTGANTPSCNWWYRSCEEDGKANGVCGTACVSNSSLHVGSQTLGDIGAAYDAAQTTHRAVRSPNINTTVAGTNAISLLFEYIEYGEPGWDYAEIYYSINGGTSWTVLESPIPVASCCGGCNGQNQGRWTTRTYVLPATCNNLTNFRLAINWINDGVSGTDPSFAMNDVRLQYTPSLPVELLCFEAEPTNQSVLIKWQTATEINNDFFTLQRAVDGTHFSSLINVDGAQNSVKIRNYSYTDNHPNPGVNYYRLKQTDLDGHVTFSDIISTQTNSDNTLSMLHLNTLFTDDIIKGEVYALANTAARVKVLNTQGEELINISGYKFNKGKNHFQFNVKDLPAGTYFLKLTEQSSSNKDRERFSIKRFVII